MKQIENGYMLGFRNRTTGDIPHVGLCHITDTTGMHTQIYIYIEICIYIYKHIHLANKNGNGIWYDIMDISHGIIGVSKQIWTYDDDIWWYMDMFQVPRWGIGPQLMAIWVGKWWIFSASRHWNKSVGTSGGKIAPMQQHFWEWFRASRRCAYRSARLRPRRTHVSHVATLIFQQLHAWLHLVLIASWRHLPLLLDHELVWTAPSRWGLDVENV